MWRLIYISVIFSIHWNLIVAARGQNTLIKKQFGDLEAKLNLQDKVISNLVHTARKYEETVKELKVTVEEQQERIDGHETRIARQEHTCGALTQRGETHGVRAHSGKPSPYIKSSYGCVAANVTLSCPENQHIIVEKADYGEWSQSCSTCCPPHPYDCTEVMAQSNFNEWLVLKVTCDNQTSCIYRFQGSTFVYNCTANSPVHYVNIYYSCLPEDEDAVVGFTAYATATTNYTENQVIIFDAVVSNLGAHYGASSGIFLCPFTGVYFFSLHLFVAPLQLMIGNIIMESTTLVQAYPRDVAGTYDSASTSVVTRCNTGQRIWVAMSGATGQLNGGRYSSFSGYLLRRD